MEKCLQISIFSLNNIKDKFFELETSMYLVDVSELKILAEQGLFTSSFLYCGTGLKWIKREQRMQTSN